MEKNVTETQKLGTETVSHALQELRRPPAQGARSPGHPRETSPGKNADIPPGISVERVVCCVLRYATESKFVRFVVFILFSAVSQRKT